jgi:hypothetical protein
MRLPRFRLVAGSLVISLVSLLALVAQALATNPPNPWP